MTEIIAVVNQKGGVGKTTTCINLGMALAEREHATLIVDLDPQGNATTGVGIELTPDMPTTYDLLLEGAPLNDVTCRTAIPLLSICPANVDLSSADITLYGRERRNYLLRDALRGDSARRSNLDFILIDCPPSLSLLTLNAMVAANSILVPLQSEYFALEGLSQLLVTVREVRRDANPDLRIEGVVVTMFDGRNRLANQVLKDAKETLGDLVYRTVVPRNVRVSEAPSFAQPVLQYDSASKGSVAYRRLATELLGRLGLLAQERTA